MLVEWKIAANDLNLFSLSLSFSEHISSCNSWMNEWVVWMKMGSTHYEIVHWTIWLENTQQSMPQVWLLNFQPFIFHSIKFEQNSFCLSNKIIFFVVFMLNAKMKLGIFVRSVRTVHVTRDVRTRFTCVCECVICVKC